MLLNVALHGMEQAAGVRYRNRARSGVETVTGTPVLVRYADLCRHPHKSAYAEDRIMPRKAWKPTGQGELVSKCSA